MSGVFDYYTPPGYNHYFKGAVMVVVEMWRAIAEDQAGCDVEQEFWWAG